MKQKEITALMVAKLNGLEGNRRLSNDIIAGVFYIVGEDKAGNLVSLREDKMVFYHRKQAGRQSHIIYKQLMCDRQHFCRIKSEKLIDSHT